MVIAITVHHLDMAMIVFHSGFFEQELVRDLLKECKEMKEFNHPNVLSLRGVCLDGGPAPFIIMPFMANGSLLSYLKENRKSLIIGTCSSMDQGDVVRQLHVYESSVI